MIAILTIVQAIMSEKMPRNGQAGVLAEDFIVMRVD